MGSHPKNWLARLSWDRQGPAFRQQEHEMHSHSYFCAAVRYSDFLSRSEQGASNMAMLRSDTIVLPLHLGDRRLERASNATDFRQH